MNVQVPPPVNTASSAAPSRRSCAGFWRRFTALLVDAFLLAFPVWLSRVLIGWIHSRLLAGVILDAGGIMASRLDTAATFARLAVTLLVPLAYFVLFEASSRAATPGKRLLGIQVRAARGSRAGFGRVVLRNLLKPLSAAPFMAGFLLVMFTPRRRALHDLLSGCLLVKTRVFRQ